MSLASPVHNGARLVHAAVTEAFAQAKCYVQVIDRLLRMSSASINPTRRNAPMPWKRLVHGGSQFTLELPEGRDDHLVDLNDGMPALLLTN